MVKLYDVYRYYEDGRKPRLQATGLDIEQAKKYCSDVLSSSKTHPKGKNGLKCEWFDGFIKR
jgi:hypothetical protein